MMPEMDGFTLAKEIREVDKTTPILFLTAKSMQEDKLEGFSFILIRFRCFGMVFDGIHWFHRPAMMVLPPDEE